MRQSQEQPKNRQRTRIDPFVDVYDSDIVPLLEGDTEGQLYARTIIELLMEKYPGRFYMSQLRTLERRVKEWRAEQGLGPEAYIPQDHSPGSEAQIDFTSGTSLGITICGEPHAHKIGQYILSYSRGRYAQPAMGETLPATLSLVQRGLETLGGTPKTIRSDGLPSCVQNRKPNTEYKDFLRYYGMRASVINPYRAHENSLVEHAHFRLKNAIKQALIVRAVATSTPWRNTRTSSRQSWTDTTADPKSGQSWNWSVLTWAPCLRSRRRCTSHAKHRWTNTV